MEESPGEFLIGKYLVPNKMSVYELAKQLHLAESTTLAFLRGDLPVTPELATRLGQIFDTPSSEWLYLQRQWDNSE